MQPIVLGYSSHPATTSALEWSVNVSKLLDSRLVIVNAFAPMFAKMPPDWVDNFHLERRAKINTQIAAAGGEGAEIVILHGAATDVLSEYTDTHGASVVVVGAHHGMGWGDVGSEAGEQALLHHLKVPLAVVRPGFEELRGGLVIVGVDGSGANLAALQWSADLAKRAGGKMLAVFAFDPIDETSVSSEARHRDSEEVRAEVEKMAGPIELVMEPGHPVEVLMDVAEREGAAAIVVGTRGRGGFHDLRVGRVPMQLVGHASCPVVVVPQPERVLEPPMA